jgi:hypothetical protein
MTIDTRVHVLATDIIGTTTTVYTAWQRMVSCGDYGTIRFIDGWTCGQVGTRRSAEVEALPARSLVRLNAARAERARQYAEAYRAIMDAYPELYARLADGTAKHCDASIILDRRPAPPTVPEQSWYYRVAYASVDGAGYYDEQYPTEAEAIQAAAGSARASNAYPRQTVMASYRYRVERWYRKCCRVDDCWSSVDAGMHRRGDDEVSS